MDDEIDVYGDGDVQADDVLSVDQDGGDAVPAGSLLAQLTEGRSRAANEQAEDFALPNNAGVLWARVRLLPWARLNQGQMAVARAKTDVSALKVLASLIAEATEGIYLRDTSGTVQAWPGGADSLPFGPDLWAHMGEQPMRGNVRPSDYVRAVLAPPSLSGVSRDGAVIAFWNTIYEWMTDAGEAVSRDFAEG